MKQISQIVDKQMREWELRRSHISTAAVQAVPGPVVSISRDLGCGGRAVAEKLAASLDCEILGRDTIDFVAEDLHAQRRLVDLLDEDGKKTLESWLDGFLHGTPVAYDEYARSLVKVIRSAALRGNVILLGRASNFILGLEEAFCVRLVAPMEHRAARIAEYESIDHAAAEKRIRASDEERATFVRRLFHRDVNDPLAYHLTLNLGTLDIDSAVELILTTMNIEGFLKKR
jgi:hypothetical protein